MRTISEIDRRRLAEAYRQHAPAETAARVLAMPPAQQDRVLLAVRENANRAGVPVEAFLDGMRPSEPRAAHQAVHALYEALLAMEKPKAVERMAEGARVGKVSHPSREDLRREFAGQVFAHLDRPSPGSIRGEDGLLAGLRYGIDKHDDPGAGGRL